MIGLMDFLFFLSVHVWESADPIRKVRGRLYLESTLKSSSRICDGWMLGKTGCIAERRRFAEGLLDGHWRRACSRVSTASRSHESHKLELVPGMFILWSLDLVGRRW